MKIYFSGIIRGGVEKIDQYQKIINYLKKYGEVINEEVNSPSHVFDSAKKYNIQDEDLYKRVLVLLSEPDVVVIGIGEDEAHAIKAGERILCLFDKNKKDKKENISEIRSVNTNMLVRDYQNIEDAYKNIDIFFQSFKKNESKK